MMIPQYTSRPTPAPTCPLTAQMIAAGTQMMPVPIAGSSDATAHSAPHTIGLPTPKIQNPRPPSTPCTSAMTPMPSSVPTATSWNSCMSARVSGCGSGSMRTQKRASAGPSSSR